LQGQNEGKLLAAKSYESFSPLIDLNFCVEYSRNQIPSKRITAAT